MGTKMSPLSIGLLSMYGFLIIMFIFTVIFGFVLLRRAKKNEADLWANRRRGGGKGIALAPATLSGGRRRYRQGGRHTRRHH